MRYPNHDAESRSFPSDLPSNRYADRLVAKIEEQSIIAFPDKLY
jgi:hypothetical protein